MERPLLTTQELKIMQILWNLKTAFVKDIIDAWPDSPQPAYNTVSTIVRILEKKGFVSHESEGRSHKYRPTISKINYQKQYLTHTVQTLFSGSMQGLLSSLIETQPISEKERAQLKEWIENEES